MFQLFISVFFTNSTEFVETEWKQPEVLKNKNKIRKKFKFNFFSVSSELNLAANAEE